MTNRLKRPKLERDRPVRSFTTLFGAGANGRSRSEPDDSSEPKASSNGAGDDDSGADASAAGRAVSDTVEMGYRVIDDYLRQGQKVAEAFNPATWMNPGQAGSPEELQKIAQRVMQYGWDFAGMWFEMWSRMGGAGVWPQGPWMNGMPFAQTSNGRRHSSAPEQRGRDAVAGSEPTRLEVEVRSSRPTSTSLELRPGPTRALIVQRLRPAVGEGPPIDAVTLEPAGDEQAVRLTVTVPDEQPAGVYNALIVDAATNLPRGTFSITVSGEARSAATDSKKRKTKSRKTGG